MSVDFCNIIWLIKLKKSCLGDFELASEEQIFKTNDICNIID